MFGAIILGLVGGAVAHLLMPRDVFQRMSGPASWLVSVTIGLIGAFVGWLILARWFGIGDDDIFDLGGLVGAVTGTMIAIPIAAFIIRRRVKRG